MNFAKMKMLEPELCRLERSARFAGEHQAAWPATWATVYETLSKCVGRGADCEELQSVYAYETAHAALHRAWRGKQDHIDEMPTWPWEAGWGVGDEDFQHLEVQHA